MSKHLVIPAAVIAIAVVIGGAYLALLGKREDAISIEAPKPASQPASQPAALRLTKVDGALVLKPVTGGERTLKVGDAVSVSDAVLAGAGASATLGVENGGTINIGGDSQVQFKGVGNDDALQFFVAGGDVEAISAGRPLEFFAAGTSGRVRVANAAARLLSDGARGLVTFAERGQVQVENAGETLVLDAGQATRLVGSKAPAKAWKLPASALLKVAWPKETELAVRKIKLSGTVTPGALVRASVPGAVAARALAADNGEFTIEVKLEEGHNDLVVQSDDLAGKHELLKRRIKVDTTPADVGVETSPDMWKKKP